MKRLLLIFVLSASAFATNYTVKSGGGGNYTTIQACATAMAAGDTCTVYAGTYAESPSVPAGTVGNYKTITVNGSDVVSVLGFTLASHTKLIGNCPTLQGTVTTATCGFFISNTSSPTTNCVTLPNGGTDIYIRLNVMYACGGIGPGYSTQVSYIYIQGNTISYTNSTVASVPTSCGGGGNPVGNSLNLYGNNFLVENNDFSHYTLSLNWNPQASITRNNNFHDTSEVNNAGNCHSDTWFSDPGGVNLVNNSFNVYEGNNQYNAVGPNAKGTLFQAPSCTGCAYAISRFNVANGLGSGNTTNNQNWISVKVYNNTVVDASYQAGSVNGETDNSSDSNPPRPSFLNGIYFYGLVGYTSINPYACGTSNSCNFGHNLAFCVMGCTTLYGHVYQVGLFTADAGNQIADPKFVSYVATYGSSSSNFALQAGSPAIAGGTYLTTVASGDSGTGTSLVLTDASYFQDGYGLTNAYSTVSPDCISITTVANHICIAGASINYATNTLSLVSGVPRSAGDHVWLYSKSDGVVVLNPAGPDLGAFPFTGGGQATTPSCSPGTGTYASTQAVTCTNANSGTTVVCYTINGATPATNGDGATCATGTVYSATLVVSATQTLKAIAGTSTLTDSSVVSYAYVISVQKVKPLAFSMMFNATANIPSGGVIDCGLTRLHDADSTRWGLIDTSTGTGAGQTSYTFTNLDAFLADVYTACGSIPAHYTLEATPANALTNTSPTPACAMDMGSGGCQPPKDLNSDGTGANLWFRNFVAAIATHVKAVGYSGTHAVPEYWEVWNEVDQSCQLNTALTSPSCAANFYAGTYAQLKRMTEDTRCIIKGVGSITATGETCAQVWATVKSVALSGPVDGSASIVLTSAHTYTAAAIAVTQNLLYCNDSPKSGSACDGIGMHNAIDIVNTHLKPCQAPCDVSSNFVEADTAGYVQALLGTEQSAELAKPQWIGEGGYSGTGWPGSGTYADNQMQQSVMLRYFLIAMTNGISSISWYTYDISNTLQGNSLNTDGWNRAYSWLNNKGFGSVVGGVPTSNSGCTLSGSLWSCSITDNVTNFLILWDQSKSCSGGSCTTANQSVSLAYTQYTDINGTVFGGIAGTVPVGIQPILLQVGSPSGPPVVGSPSNLLGTVH